MDNVRSFNHTVWDCKYHVVWIPKCRRKVLCGQLRKHLGEIFRELAIQFEYYCLGRPEGSSGSNTERDINTVSTAEKLDY